MPLVVGRSTPEGQGSPYGGGALRGSEPVQAHRLSRAEELKANAPTALLSVDNAMATVQHELAAHSSSGFTGPFGYSSRVAGRKPSLLTSALR